MGIGKLRGGSQALCCRDQSSVARDGKQSWGAWPFMESFLPPTCTGPGVRMGQVGGSPVHSCDSWCSLGPGLWSLLLGQPYRVPPPCQLADGALVALLSLVWRWLPVPLCLLRLV